MAKCDIEIDIAGLLYQIADRIRYYERVCALPDCNTCGKKQICEYCPDWGGQTRINCPLYEGEMKNG